MIADLVCAIIAVVVAVFAYYKWTYQYWKRKNVPQIEPQIPFGNTTNPLLRKENRGVTIKKFYDEFKRRQVKHGGLYLMLSPTYVVVDLDYVKNIMTKDFHHFVDRGFYYNEENDPLSAHLFAIGGQKWRNLRTKLTPTFTSGRMKQMFEILMDCESGMQKKIQAEWDKNAPIDIKEILGCFTTDVIGSCAFGLDLKSLNQENSPFRIYGKKVFASSPLRSFKNNFVFNFPNLSRRLGVSITPTEITEFFLKVVKDTVEYRERNNYTRKDFMQLLIDLKNNKLEGDDGHKYDGKTLTIEEIAAQSFVFFLAGFETSSTTMTFALYELSKHPDIQNRVRDEIKQVLAKHNGKITYESIHDLKYMNQVIDETLRKYPALPMLTRKCIKDYKLPDEDIVIEKGTRVVLPILGIHYDSDHYPEPEKFDPDRFTEENIKTRHAYAHLPFGEGPRMCIGMRFGLMQTKVGLTSLLSKYKFTVSEKTKEPLQMQVHSFVLAAEGEIWLNAQKI